MHLLDIASLTKETIEDIFRLADRIKANPHGFHNSLEGKCCVLFFPESSLRTRVTFEKAIADMGGKSILFPPATLDKKERLEDVMGYMANWIDLIIVRHGSQEKVCELARHSSVPVVNAMTSYIHPCEIISDLYSYRERDIGYASRGYTFIGEHANILQSWIEASSVMDLQFNHVYFNGRQAKDDTRNYRFATKIEEVLPMTDHLLTDPVPPEERTVEYLDNYRIDMRMIERARRAGKADLTINPCPPFNVDVEVTEEVLATSHFVGYSFKKNLLNVQKAIILKCLEDVR